MAAYQIVSLLILSLSLPTSLLAAEPALPPATGAEALPAGLISLSDESTFSPHFLLVDKKKRVLRVYKNEDGYPKRVLEVPSDLGKMDGDKMRENDHRTPVGIYFLQEKKTQPEIPFKLYGNLAFTTDYPNIFDRRAEKGGSGIWLHAIPDEIPLTRGSRGCVVVRNDVIQSLEKYVKLKDTPLVIFDEITEVPKPDYDKMRSKYVGFIETWRSAWQNDDVDAYMKFYDSTFANSNMNYRQWYRHKKKLKGLYKSIAVNLSEPLVINTRDQVVIRFLQHYKSDLHEDFGQKTIHARYSEEQGFQIIREDWSPKVFDPSRLSTSSKAAKVEGSGSVTSHIGSGMSQTLNTQGQ